MLCVWPLPCHNNCSINASSIYWNESSEIFYSFLQIGPENHLSFTSASPTLVASCFHEWVRRRSLSWTRGSLGDFCPEPPPCVGICHSASRVWLMAVPGAGIPRCPFSSNVCISDSFAGYFGRLFWDTGLVSPLLWGGGDFEALVNIEFDLSQSRNSQITVFSLVSSC